MMVDPVVVDPMIDLVLHIPLVRQDRETEVAEVIEEVMVQAAAVVAATHHLQIAILHLHHK